MRPAFHRGALFTASVVTAIVIMTWLPSDALAQESMSLDLDTAVQMATAHNRKTKMREDETDAAVYRRQQATGRFLPKLSLYARYGRVSHVEPGSLSLPAPTDPSATNNVQLGEAVDNQYSLRLSVVQALEEHLQQMRLLYKCRPCPVFTALAAWWRAEPSPAQMQGDVREVRRLA